MNECLLCQQPIASTPSWKGLLGLEKQTEICLDCSKKFKRADIIEEGSFSRQPHFALYIQRSDAGLPASVQISARRRTCSRFRE